MAAQGYFKDDFLKLFVSSPKSRRAPLINRGYYIRARIIDDVLKTFLAQFEDVDKQVGGCTGKGCGSENRWSEYLFILLLRNSGILTLSLLLKSNKLRIPECLYNLIKLEGLIHITDLKEHSENLV